MSEHACFHAITRQTWLRVLPIICVAGCSITPTLNERGPASLAAANYQLPVLPASGQTPVSPSQGLVGNFEMSYARARADALQVSSGIADAETQQAVTPQAVPGILGAVTGCSATNGSCSPYSIHSRQMAVDGVALADQNCKNYFDTLGKIQQYVQFSRDILASAGSIGGGVAGLVSGAAAAPAAVGFAIATSDTGLDIYTRNFLFGADNIDSVKSLISTAESVHTSTVLPEPDNSAWTFDQAQQVVTDHQDICVPAHVLLLTRAAIANGKVTAFDDQGNPVTSKQQNPPNGTAGSGKPPSPAPVSPLAASQSKLKQATVPATTGEVASAGGTTFGGGRPATRRVMLRVVPGG